jgi:hypothetical protein
MYTGVDGRVILKWIFEKLDGGIMDWIDLAQDMNRWLALVNEVINLCFQKMREIL